MQRINQIYRLADCDELRYGIAHYDRNANPDVFCAEDGGTRRVFDWSRAYDGARTVLNWYQ